MICGIGTDLVRMERMARWVENPQWAQRILSPEEQQLYMQMAQPLQWLAGRWAAKEAVAKALGCGLAGCPPQHVSVMPDSQGCPKVELTGAALERLHACGGVRIWVSITHDGEYAAAYAVAEGE